MHCQTIPTSVASEILYAVATSAALRSVERATRTHPLTDDVEAEVYDAREFVLSAVADRPAWALSFWRQERARFGVCRTERSLVHEESRYAPALCFDGYLRVNVYAVSQEYGGPEEGGWWYRHKELVESHPAATERDAHLHAAAICEAMDMGRMAGDPHMAVLVERYEGQSATVYHVGYC